MVEAGTMGQRIFSVPVLETRAARSRAWRSFATLSCAAVIATMASGGAVPSPASPAEAPFLAENRAAMDRMMAAMAVSPSGDVDYDFAAMMVPHHQGAIEMAQAELRYGRNEQLRRIAQEIIVDQQQEIVAMRLALGQRLPPSLAAPDQPPDASIPASHSIPKPSIRSQEER
jgi:hypothetical protein